MTMTILGMCKRLTYPEIMYLGTKYKALMSDRVWYFLAQCCELNYSTYTSVQLHDMYVRRLHLLIIAQRIGKHISNMNLSNSEHQRMLLKG